MNVPVWLRTCERSRSPLDRCFNLKSRTILDEMVPLPEPGGPKMTARNTRLIIPACPHRINSSAKLAQLSTASLGGDAGPPAAPCTGVACNFYRRVNLSGLTKSRSCLVLVQDVVIFWYTHEPLSKTKSGSRAASGCTTLIHIVIQARAHYHDVCPHNCFLFFV